MSERSVYCPICSSTRLTLRYHKWGLPIFACKDCSGGFTGNTDDFKPEEYYSGSYFEGGYADGYAGYGASEPHLRREFRDSVRYLKRFVPKGTLLDVGCAYGYFLQEAAGDFACVGLDVSQEAINVCKKNGLNGFCGEVGAVALPGEPFDVVTMFDSIEHVPDPLATVTKIGICIKPGGILMVTTGDWGSLSARLFGKHWRLLTPPQHLFFFTRKSMTALLERSGFAVERIDVPWKFVPLTLVAYQIINRLGLKFDPPRFLDHFSIPLNLFDTMRVIAKKV